MDVSAWLRQLGLGEYAAAFAANHIDLATLRQLSMRYRHKLGWLSPSAAGSDRAARRYSERDQSRGQIRYGARRPVTVLFADLCGFTVLSRDLADERLHALLPAERTRYLVAGLYSRVAAQRLVRSLWAQQRIPLIAGAPCCGMAPERRGDSGGRMQTLFSSRR